MICSLESVDSKFASKANLTKEDGTTYSKNVRMHSGLFKDIQPSCSPNVITSNKIILFSPKQPSKSAHMEGSRI